MIALYVEHQVYSENEKTIEDFFERNFDGNFQLLLSNNNQNLDLSEYVVLIAQQTPELPNIIAKMPNLRWLHILSSGVDNYIKIHDKRSELIVSASQGVNSFAVAETVVAAMLSQEKRIIKYWDQKREKQWNRFRSGSLFGKKIAIFGAGNIGREVQNLCASFQAKCVFVNGGKFPRPNSAQKIVPFEDAILEEENFDYVVVCLPRTSETFESINASLLSTLKKATLINVSRGGIVKECDLKILLDKGNLDFVFLDVFENEPLSSASWLWSHPNVFISPHVSGTSPTFMIDALDIFLNNFSAWIDDGKLPNQVDLNKGY